VYIIMINKAVVTTESKLEGVFNDKKKWSRTVSLQIF